MNAFIMMSSPCTPDDQIILSDVDGIDIWIRKDERRKVHPCTSMKYDGAARKVIRFCNEPISFPALETTCTRISHRFNRKLMFYLFGRV